MGSWIRVRHKTQGYAYWARKKRLREDTPETAWDSVALRYLYPVGFGPKEDDTPYPPERCTKAGHIPAGAFEKFYEVVS